MNRDVNDMISWDYEEIFHRFIKNTVSQVEIYTPSQEPHVTTRIRLLRRTAVVIFLTHNICQRCTHLTKRLTFRSGGDLKGLKSGMEVILHVLICLDGAAVWAPLKIHANSCFFCRTAGLRAKAVCSFFKSGKPGGGSWVHGNFRGAAWKPGEWRGPCCKRRQWEHQLKKKSNIRSAESNFF